MGLQVIVALEPRAFRDVVSGALRDLRPELVVHPVDGEQVPSVLETVEVDLVIASQVDETFSSRLRWLVCGDPAGATLLAPTGTARFPTFDFSTLLSIVDGLTRSRQSA